MAQYFLLIIVFLEGSICKGIGMHVSSVRLLLVFPFIFNANFRYVHLL